MSAPPKFATLPDAIAAYREGRSRRWAEVDGWQIDLEQAAAEASRVRDEPAVIGVSADEAVMALVGRPAWDRMVGDSVARELARTSEVLPELAVPSEPPPDASANRCPWCSRPWDGAP